MSRYTYRGGRPWERLCTIGDSLIVALLFAFRVALVGIVVLALTMLFNATAYASEQWDVVSTAGMTYKLPGLSSYVATAECKKVVVVQPTSPRGPEWYSCGGDNPAFIGWPIAAQRTFGPLTVRAGWHHSSQWTDRNGELIVNSLGAEVILNWSQWYRSKRK